MINKATAGDMANKLKRRLKPYGFLFVASNRSPKKSFYLKKEGIPPIRVSDHHLHPNQERYKLIDVVLNDDEKSVNLKELVLPDTYTTGYYCTVIVERIALEIVLFNKKLRIDPYSGNDQFFF